MKNKVILRMTLFMVAVFVFSTCGKLPMEKAQDAYDATQVVPIVIGTSGPAMGLQTFKYLYGVTYSRAGSTWAWTATDATIDSTSPDKRTIRVLFETVPANDTATIKVVETTGGGLTAEKILKIKVKPFCPLAVGGFVGSWTGTDGQGADYTYSSTVTTTLDGTKILVDGLNVGFMGDFWGESIVSGGTCLMTVNNDGTVVIPEQFFCNTDYSDGYKIKGSGTWDNCGAKPSLVINYDIWWPDKSRWLAVYYKSLLGNKDYLTATITMD